ncbi:hypothetical protein A3A76_03045 [Candidatus Woesebacteria bacterium RIFCSPLOWO2_01_FULL_39_23]|uniref:Uncharacterized protein n=1 Tax=Candidatus Woesebacteria bacterium RIFCSPHIGHO2_01_FULL_40_22 TaxID=1802499 RepID=A0A1F7YKM7_9BACT|nr:MAG: hypothetical protein A2141_00975 [Candidatus Woesebacteria bacterium RBG_16_40_11]OGM27439.1 MAG: hypothetical protein A2628_01450 [Candidatus Woesebacteria bacterium RIFCSPHIGHO2_01_FULL_40_22]OGM36450.1 MAG: hypothetical protein A3E41_02900 [Candidatus Woesebacteria bacterium RIFCSPHIGHO2_12_FULL_38_9]OGM62611.1 MAG: hypothetical protein A3A76_03045 [Candidatus Woesebacteria bacterium RIFCSPLOWO2_01_FULL_39_23]
MEEISGDAVSKLTNDPDVKADAINLFMSYVGVRSYQHAVEIAIERKNVATGGTPTLHKQLFPGLDIPR